MSCLLNNRLIKSCLFIYLIFFNFFIFLTESSVIFAAEVSDDPFNETVRILERWTSAHWGRDCFVWVVHYPRDLIEPWVEAEAIKSGMNDSEKASYRRTFISELKLDNSETFLISIYSFGARAVDISPVRDNVALITSSGERIKPSRYDSSLDHPSGGVVQGLVFFPKQNDKNFVVALKNIGIDDERIFSFGPPDFKPEQIQEKKPEVVVVNLPKKRAPVKKEEPEIPPPPPPVVPSKPVKPIFNDDSKEMADFINSVKKRETASKDKTPEKIASSNKRPSNIDNSYISREHLLRNFLILWSENKSNEMYDMLSDASKKIISRENFAKEVAKASDFRSGLKGDYRIEWIGEERAKVITNHRMLVFRTLVSRTLGVIREGSAWKIVW